MFGPLDQMIRDALVAHGRSAELLDYTPYLVAIGTPLAWFIRGLSLDCVRAARYWRRRRSLRLLPGPGEERESVALRTQTRV